MNAIIQTEQLTEQSDEMRTVATHLYEISERVLQVKMALFEKTLSDRFSAVLQQSAGAVEMLAVQTESMGRVLDCISTEYCNCENRVIDSAEGNSIISGGTRERDLYIIPGCYYRLTILDDVWRDVPVTIQMNSENTRAPEFVGW